MVNRDARGDAARTLALLWEGRYPRGDEAGQRTALSLDAIVEAATALADARGTAAVPLRAVGERLGCTAMALYTYVGGKDELLDVMYDRAHAAFAATPVASVAEWAERLLDLYVAHPWMLDLAHTRPVLGPHQQEVFEALLGLLLPTVDDRRDVAAIASSSFSLAAAAARSVVDARRQPHPQEPDAARGRSERMEALATAAPDFSDRFPLSTTMMDGATADGGGRHAGDVPPMEHAARDNLRRSVELLLAGSGRPPTA